MKRYDFFNKQRVNAKDINDFEQWQEDNISTEIGTLMNYGLIRPSQSETNSYYKVLGQNNGAPINLYPASWTIVQNGANALVNILVPNIGVDCLLAYDRAGNLIVLNTNTAYSAIPIPAGYTNSGNIGIPLGSGTGYYDFWVGYQDIMLPTISYPKTDKDGNQQTPAIVPGYYFEITYSATQAVPAQPVDDVIYIGRVYYNSSN